MTLYGIRDGYQKINMKKVIMMYNHKTINLPEIKATTTDGVRLYETPDGNLYPSITTVLSIFLAIQELQKLLFQQ